LKYRRQKNKNPERAFLKDALNYLKWTEHVAFMIKTTGVVIRGTNRWHKDPYRATGLPDLLIILKGFSVFCELKQGNNRPSLNQKMRLSENANAGGFSMVCYDLDDLDTGLNVVNKLIAKRLKHGVFNNLGDNKRLFDGGYNSPGAQDKD